MSEQVAAISVTVLGLCFGSFLNVVIARLPRGENIAHPRSRCFGCNRQLTWFENIPVVSWLALRGRCRTCKAKVSVRYLVVEVLVGCLFLACWQRFGPTWLFLGALVFVCLLVALTFIDAEHWILPFELTLPGIALGVLVAVPAGMPAVKASLIGGAVAFCGFRALEYLGWLAFKKEALGAGDKFLFAMLGTFLGWQPLLGILMLSSLQGSAFGIARLALTGRAGPAVLPLPAAASGAEAGVAAPAPGAAPPVPAAAPATSDDEQPRTMTWEFMKPGLTPVQRLLAVPYALFLQPIPDEPVDEGGEEVDWQPGVTNLPFGPWLALAGLEVLLLGPWLADRLRFLELGWMFAS